MSHFYGKQSLILVLHAVTSIDAEHATSITVDTESIAALSVHCVDYSPASIANPQYV